MTPDDRALAGIETAMKGLPRCDQKAAARALMRLAGNALAALTDHQQAGSEHTQLGRQHFVRGPRR